MGLCASSEENRVGEGSDVERVQSREKGFRAQLVSHEVINDIRDIYEIEEELGSGMSGAVHRVRDKKTGEHYALKTVQLNRIDDGMLEDLWNEINLLKQLDHPNIIKLVATHKDSRRLYLTMELCTGGELFDRLQSRSHKRYTERDAAVIVKQMAGALSYIHARKICHRDLKLENFVFETESENAALKLIDFGLSKKYMHGMHMTSLVGTPYYISPEALNGKAYGLACDIWALGVITYILLCGKPPFNGTNDGAILIKVARGRFTFHHDVWSKVSTNAKQFITSLLQYNPKQRPTISQVLQHKWLADVEAVPETQLTNDVFSSLMTFSKDAGLKRAALTTIAFSLKPSQMSELRDAFLSIDTDFSGAIGATEFKRALESRGLSDEQINTMFAQLDQDGTGIISWTEFLAAAMRRRQFLTEERLEAAFDKLDIDHSGYITRENLKDVMGDDYDKEKVDAMIAEADVAGDGRISQAEFLRLFRDDLATMREELTNAAASAGVDVVANVKERMAADPEVPDDPMKVSQRDIQGSDIGGK